MVGIERLLADIIAVRDTDAVRRLCLDAWLYGQAHGEAAGEQAAHIVLAGVREYRAIEQSRRGRETGRAGAVLGTRAPPGGELWWLGEERLRTKVKPRMARADRAPDWATYWSDSAAGWWRIPETREEG